MNNRRRAALLSSPTVHLLKMWWYHEPPIYKCLAVRKRFLVTKTRGSLYTGGLIKQGSHFGGETEVQKLKQALFH